MATDDVEGRIRAGEAQLEELHGRLAEVERGVKAAAAAARDGLSRWHGVPSTSLPIPNGVDAMATELEAVSATERHAEAVVGLQQVVKGLEGVVRELGQLQAEDPIFREYASQAIDVCAATASHSAALQPLL
eukprot:CAMPEP_0177758606 /NCGR_PEP_ID=MMETSP0491_2-20121128/4280_1 /TAXON_ID=63592 /ORGANISM="Tetraselmis chuii, Strain PLY429" /LENGTH=131 /DNA_ID=CAMNT_0019274363 /DNA_START=168 /DNA_END=560 /DNA_ORIENTATION=-